MVSKSGKAPETNKADAEHQQHQDSHTVLVDGRDTFEEHSELDRTGLLAITDVDADRFFTTAAFHAGNIRSISHGAGGSAVWIRIDVRGVGRVTINVP